MTRGPIAAKVADDMKSASFIREMFEVGRRLKAEHGEENVFDFSLGNPNASPPDAFFTALRACAAERQPALHRYMPNAGFDEARAAVAAFLSAEYGVAFAGGDVLLTSGAAGAINTTLRALLDPGDEVIVFVPFFPEYRFYIEQAGGRVVFVETDAAFQPDLARLEAAITPRTRAILVNSPNNPTGAVYSATACSELTDIAARHDRPERPLYLICDDVYRRISYGGGRVATAVGRYSRAVITSSYSKDLSVPGERMGYVALPPLMPGRAELMGALTMLNRTLGFVNASAFMQRVLTRCATALCDVELYRGNRDLLCHALRDYGYELTIPQGALYAFPRTPLADDRVFVNVLLKHRILAVPGTGFGRGGHMRLSYCVERRVVEGALPGFKRAIEEARSGAK